MTSNLDLDANGCGSPVLSHIGLIVTVLFWLSLETGVLLCGSSEAPYEKERDSLTYVIETERLSSGAKANKRTSGFRISMVVQRVTLVYEEDQVCRLRKE